MSADKNSLIEEIERMAALKALVLEIARIRDLDDLFAHVSRETSRILNADDVAILLEEPKRGGLTLWASGNRVEGIELPRTSPSILLSVFNSRESRMTADAPAEADFNPQIGKLTGKTPQSLLAVPIAQNDLVFGVIEAIDKHGGCFTEADKETLITVAAHVATCVEHSWLLQASEELLGELSTQYEIGQAIARSLDRETLFNNLASALERTTGIRYFSISSWDPSSGTLSPLYSTLPANSEGNDFRTEGTQLASFPRLGNVLEQGRGEIVLRSENEGNGGMAELLHSFDLPVAIVIPIINRNKSTGVLELFPESASILQDHRLELYQSIANQIAVALENTRLYEETLRQTAELEKHVIERTGELEHLYRHQTELTESEREQRRLAETLREAGAVVARSLDLDEAITAILNQLQRVVPHDSASIQLFRDNDLVIVGGGGWEDNEAVLGHRFPIPGDNPNTIVMEAKEPRILNIDELSSFGEFMALTRGEIRSWLGVPLIKHDTILGMLTLDSGEQGFFKEHHAETARAFADQVAVAIEQALLFEQTQAALNERDTLRAIAAEITAELDLKALLGSVLVRACDLLDASSGELGLYREALGAVEIVAAHDMKGDYIGTHIELGKGAIGLTAQIGESLIIQDYGQWDNALSQYKDDNPWRAVMSTPLIYHQRLIGVIAVADMRESRAFKKKDLELLDMLAHQSAIAIENAQLFQRVQSLATTDELTGLHNRRELFRLGGELMEQTRKKEGSMAAVMFDIDLFKGVNDSFGHGIGDQVLQGLAEICCERIRQRDVLGRYGGEEFTLLLPDSKAGGAYRIAERLRATIEKKPIETDRGEISITVSFGVAMLTSTHAGLAALLDDADAALYLAKKRGRNRVETLDRRSLA